MRLNFIMLLILDDSTGAMKGHGLTESVLSDTATESGKVSSETGTKRGHTLKEKEIAGMTTEFSSYSSQNGNISSYIFVVYEL